MDLTLSSPSDFLTYDKAKAGARDTLVFLLHPQTPDRNVLF